MLIPPANRSTAAMYPASGSHCRRVRFASFLLQLSPCRTCNPSTGSPRATMVSKPVLAIASCSRWSSAGDGRIMYR
eukprot:2250459-Prymnesium_polylepis.1